ncbi:hypothetical protein CR513_29232, partial [Mucuna pruriens]
MFFLPHCEKFYRRGLTMCKCKDEIVILFSCKKQGRIERDHPNPKKGPNSRDQMCHSGSTTLSNQEEKRREYETWEERVEHLRVVLQVLIDKDLRDSNLVCEVTLKSMKLGMLKVTNDLMEGSRKTEFTLRYLENCLEPIDRG